MPTPMLAPRFEVHRAEGSCPAFPYSNSDFRQFEAADAKFPGKTFEMSDMVPLDGKASGCVPETRDGVAMDASGQCVDLGTSTTSALTAARKANHAVDFFSMAGSSYNFPLEFLPKPGGAPTSEWAALASKLQTQLERQQFGGNGGPYSLSSNRGACGLAGAPAWRSMYYVDAVPQLGFGSVVEYGMMFLARSFHLKSQLVFGRRSSRVWTSPRECGRERSLTCYFNVTSCCGHFEIGGQALSLPRRRNPLNLGLSGFNQYGAAWLNGQLAHFFFRHMTAATRREVEQRRATVLSGPVKCIGMHIRGGDACHSSRYCPSNLTSTFFAVADRMRSMYGVHTIVLATDSSKAASLCTSGVMGFDCRTLKGMDRNHAAAQILHWLRLH